MENLTIQNSKELASLAAALKVTPSDLVEELLNYLVEWEVIGDELDVAGQTIKQVLVDNKSIPEAIAYMAIGTRKDEEVKLMCSLVIHWSGGECPECGYHMETETDGAHGQEWENAKCLNGNCGHVTTTEPLTNFSFEDE